MLELDQIIKDTNRLLLQLRILLLEQRLREQELLFEGQQIIEKILGHKINVN